MSVVERPTSWFGVLLQEVWDSCLCCKFLIIFDRDSECVVAQRRHISIDGYWVGT